MQKDMIRWLIVIGTWAVVRDGICGGGDGGDDDDNDEDEEYDEEEY